MRPGRGLAAVAVTALALALATGAWLTPSIARPFPDDHAPRAPAVAPTAVVGHTAGLVLSLVPNPQRGAAPLRVNVTATITGGAPPYSLTLCFGVSDHASPAASCDAPITGWTAVSPVIVSHAFPGPGNFSILGLANDSAGESVGSSSLVVVTPASVAPVIVSADEETTSGTAPLSVTFNESISGDVSPISLAWSYGDGATANGAAGVPITHVYTQIGSFSPVLTVRDGSGHESSQALPPITVVATSARPTTLVPGLSPITAVELVTAFGVAAMASAISVFWLRHRRWRLEGDEIVTWLRAEGRRETRPPRTP